MYLIPNAKKRDLKAFQEDMDKVLRWLQSGAIGPAIAAILPLADARKAHLMRRERALKVGLSRGTR